jgi:exodeoxyribonuclease V gamma subunit
LHRPLKFFPKSSLEYADSGKLNNAAGIWNHRKYPEKDDLYFNLCFGGIDPLDEEFMATAQAVFSPCLASKVVVP